MKQSVLVVLAVTAVLGAAFIPASFAGGINCVVGPKVGLNLANLGGDDIADGETDSRSALVVGGFLDIGVHELLTVRPEVLYSQQGAKEPGSDFRAEIDYVQIPILAKVMVPTHAVATPHFLIGPVIGFEAGCEFTDGTDRADCSDLDLDIKGSDFGMAFGGGVDFNVGPGVLNTDVRYNLGLRTIDDTDEADIKNRVISLTAGWGFRLGG